MKIITIVTIAIGLCGFQSHAADHLFSTDNELLKQLSSTHGEREKISLLKREIDAGGSSKYDALLLLREIRSDDSVRLLFDNLDFTMNVDGVIKRPALNSLINMGEITVPQALQYIEQSTNKELTAAAVELLVEIKGDKYDEFVKKNKNSLTPKAFNALVMYSVK